MSINIYLKTIIEHNIDTHEKIVQYKNDKLGLNTFISIHNTKFGPAAGGCRIKFYETELDALNDALSLSKAMTYKNTIADLKYGGGKMVVIANNLDLERDKNKIFKELGNFINDFGGQFRCGMDMGMNDEYFTLLSKHTNHLVGFVDGKIVNPSPVTAYGVYIALKEIAFYLCQKLDNFSFGIQGIGQVGKKVVKYLTNNHNVEIYVSDSDPNAFSNFDYSKYNIRSREKIYFVDNILDFKYDFFCPCAVGGIINNNNIDQLKCHAIVGAANNQLESDKLAIRLKERSIIYAPDYVVNCGGVVYAAMKDNRKDEFEIAQKINSIMDNVLYDIIEKSEETGLDTVTIANKIVEDKLTNV